MHLLFPLIFFFLVLIIILKFTHKLIYVPWTIQKHFNKQGIQGPPYRLFYGNSLDIQDMMKEAHTKPIPSFSNDGIIQRVTPEYFKWANMYGNTFLYWVGTTPTLAIADPDMIKEVLLNKSGLFDRTDLNPFAKLVFGKGLAGLVGEKWARHRRIAAQAFKIERVKACIPEIVISTLKMLENWEEDQEFEIDVHKELHNLAADVISRTAFGSNYEEGKQIFLSQDQQVHLLSQAQTSIPGFRFVPTKNSRLIWKLEKNIQESVRMLIKKNGENCKNSKNLLGLLMLANKDEQGLGEDEIIDECQSFHFEGKDTISSLLTWALVLLSNHQEWQIKAREEINSVFGETKLPTAENINSLKMVALIVDETLRLYPPAVLLMRTATKNTKLGTLNIPAETQLYLPMTAVHRDTKIWGEDAEEFNPMRFASRGKGRQDLASFFPFGLGSRACVGQNLVIMEAKVIIAMIIHRFEFRLSPSYLHAPTLFLSLQPQYGAQILFTRI